MYGMVWYVYRCIWQTHAHTHIYIYIYIYMYTYMHMQSIYVLHIHISYVLLLSYSMVDLLWQLTTNSPLFRVITVWGVAPKISCTVEPGLVGWQPHSVKLVSEAWILMGHEFMEMKNTPAAARYVVGRIFGPVWSDEFLLLATVLLRERMGR